MKLKLSSTFYLAIVALASLFPLAMGVTPASLGLSLLVVALSALLVEPGASHKRHAFGQLGEAGENVNVEKEYKEVKANLEQVNSQLKTFGEDVQKQIKNYAAVGEETKARVDDLLTQQGDLQARLKAAEQQIVDMDNGGGQQRPQTLGQTVVEHDNYANFNGTGRLSIDVEAAITSDTSSGGDLIDPDRRPGIIATPQQRLVIRDLLNWVPTSSNSVEFVRETGFTNNADVVSENPSGGKPESDITFEEDAVKIATIAHWIHASRQVLSDARMLAAHIDGRLRYGLKLKEEGQLLKGSGVGLNIHGIYPQASAYANPGVTVQNETLMDRLRIAMLQVTLAEYDADGLVLNPIDWTSIELTKTTDNAYLFATPRGMAAPGLWGRPVVATQSMTQSEFLTGSFSMGAEGYDGEQISVQVSTEDRDNFIKNMVTVLCEERVGLAVLRPEAFVKGDFDDLLGS